MSASAGRSETVAVSIVDSYRACRQVCRMSRSSFLASFGCLDAPRRDAMFALYAFARITDDIADSPLPATHRRQRLLGWRQQLHQHLAMATHAVGPPQWSTPSLAAQAESHPRQVAVLPALADAVGRYDIPAQSFDQMLEGALWDTDHQPLPDWQTLLKYCSLVASSVGVACGHIWKSGGSFDERAAADCGIAFQLTNILRDAAEDARAGRLYLPVQLLAEFGISTDHWLEGAPEGPWPAMVEHVGHLTRGYYDSGWTIHRGLTTRSQRMFSMMWHGYRTLLDEVLANKERLFTAPKPRLNWLQKSRLWLSHAGTIQAIRSCQS